MCMIMLVSIDSIWLLPKMSGSLSPFSTRKFSGSKPLKLIRFSIKIFLLNFGGP